MKLKKLDGYDYEISKMEIRYLQVEEWAHPKKKCNYYSIIYTFLLLINILLIQKRIYCKGKIYYRLQKKFNST